MKKSFSIFALLSSFFCTAQSNLDFENWDINHKGVDEAIKWVNTANATKYDAPHTLFKEVEKPAKGLASIKLITAYWEQGSAYGLDTLVGSIIQQTKYAKRPESFEFVYKSYPKLGDEILVGIQLTATINGSIIIVGEGFFTSNQEKENWTTKKINIEYYSENIPNNINIIALSSANAVIINGTNGYSKIGSTLYLDNLKLNLKKEILPNSNYYIHVFPNPAKEFINIKTNSLNNQQLEIYDLTSKLVLTANFTQQSKINISNLPSGTYIYKVFDSNSKKITATDKFNIIR